MYYDNKELISRLREYAAQNSVSYKYVITSFFQEEFLRRVMQSQYSKELVLRGSYLIYQMTDFEGRRPDDLDFMILNSDYGLEQIIEDIISCNNGEGGISFSYSEIKQPINRNSVENFVYQITGNILNLKHSFKVSLGFVKDFVHEPEEFAIPTVLDGFEEPTVKVCSIETVIAEKFDKILRKFELTDCMKDLYDINLLSVTFDFNGYELQRAVSETLRNAKNDSNEQRFAQLINSGGDIDFVNRWQHFCRTVDSDLDFSEVLWRFEKFLSPIWKSICKDTRWKLDWSGTSGQWDEEMYLF